MFAQILVAVEESTPISTINQDGSPLGSPGISGFLVMMVLGSLIILLGLDLTRRARRLRYRNDYAMAREAEERAQQAAEQTATGKIAEIKPQDGDHLVEEAVAEKIRRAH